MKIVKLERTEKTIYQLTCLNLWGRKKVYKIFPFLFGWRYCDTGKNIPYRIDVSVGNIANDMEIGDVKIL